MKSTSKNYLTVDELATVDEFKQQVINPELLAFIDASKQYQSNIKRKKAIGWVLLFLFLSALGFSLYWESYQHSIELAQKVEVIEVEKQKVTKAQTKAEKALVEAKHNYALALNEKAISLVESKNYAHASIMAVNSLINAKEEKMPVEALTILSSSFNFPKLIFKYQMNVISNYPGNAVWLSDNEHIAFTNSRQLILIKNIRTGEKLKIRGHKDKIRRLLPSRDGRLYSYSNTEVRVWDIKTKNSILLIHEPNSGIDSISLTKDGSTLLYGNINGIYALKIDDGKIHKIHSNVHDVGVFDLLFSPDGKVVAATTIGNELFIWSTEDQELIFKRTYQDHWPLLFFSSGSDLLALHENGSSLSFFDIEEMKTAKNETLPISKFNLNRISSGFFFDDDQSLILTTGDEIFEWDINAESVNWRLPTDNIYSKIQLSPNGKLLLASSGNTITVFSMPTEKDQNYFNGLYEGKIEKIKFSTLDKLLVALTDKNELVIWDIKTSQSKVLALDKKLSVLDFIIDGFSIYYALSNGIIHKNNLFTGQSSTKDNLNFEIDTFNFSPDLKSYAFTTSDKLAIYDVKNKNIKNIYTFSESTDKYPVTTLKFSEDSNLLLSSSLKGELVLWNVSKRNRKLLNVNRNLQGIDFLQTDNSIYILHTGGLVQKWNYDIESVKSIVSFDSENKKTKLHFSSLLSIKDNQYSVLAKAVDFDGVHAVRIENLISKQVAILKLPIKSFTNIAFSSDGNNFAVITPENKILILDISTIFLNKNNLSKQIESLNKASEYSLRGVTLHITDSLIPRKDKIAAWNSSHPLHWQEQVEKGDPEALLQLGIIAQRDKEWNKAKEWYLKSKAAGHQNAEYRLNINELMRKEYTQ